MTRRVWWIAVGLVATVAVTGGALGSSASIGRTTKLKLLDVSDKFEFVDVGRPATGEGDFSPGDMLIFENILRKAHGTKDVGNFISNCTMSVPPMALCRGTLWLQDGKIELSTAVNFADADIIESAVTGGTRRFKTARGHAILGEEVSEGVRKLTVVLVP
jgi:hypothetical protein